MILFFLIIMCEENSSEPKSSETPKSRDRDDRLSEPARSRRVTESEILCVIIYLIMTPV